MRAVVEWLDDALAAKDIVMAMTHFRVKDRFMTATNGRIVAGYPCEVDGEFLVPGDELKQIFKRLPDDPAVTVKNDAVHLRSGRFSGTLQLLPPDEWRFPTLEQGVWKALPSDLLPILRDLRPFISEDANHRWSLGIAIDDGWCYASNNSVLAGAPLLSSKDKHALIPIWVADFILERAAGLEQWAITETHMSFLWRNGAWMRSTLIDDVFPKQAGEMIRSAQAGTQKISKDYRQAITRICELSDHDVKVYNDRVEGRTARTTVREDLVSETPEGSEFSLWSNKLLAPAINVATSWSPSLWPKPVPFKGDRVRGFIAGRNQ